MPHYGFLVNFFKILIDFISLSLSFEEEKKKNTKKNPRRIWENQEESGITQNPGEPGRTLKVVCSHKKKWFDNWRIQNQSRRRNY